MIIVTLIVIVFYMHDCVIADCALFQAGIKAEQQLRQLNDTKDLYQGQNVKRELQKNYSLYVQEKSIFAKNINADLNKKNNVYYLYGSGNLKLLGLSGIVLNIDRKVEIKENCPPDFIRKINAVKKLENL